VPSLHRSPRRFPDREEVLEWASFAARGGALAIALSHLNQQGMVFIERLVVGRKIRVQKALGNLIFDVCRQQPVPFQNAPSVGIGHEKR
jgi:hypothetical protein